MYFIFHTKDKRKLCNLYNDVTSIQHQDSPCCLAKAYVLFSTSNCSCSLDSAHLLSPVSLSASPEVAQDYESNPFNFLSTGVTWKSQVSGGFQSVETPEECQLICADSSDCDSVTWFDSKASPYPNYCQMYIAPDPSTQVICVNCSSGPESCICSGDYICSLDSDQLVELIFEITSEVACASQCFQSSECNYYSWYSPNNQGLKDACALLKGCLERTGNPNCHSGPMDCSDTEVILPDYPLCFDIGLTWSEEMSRGVPNITSTNICQDMCNADSECIKFSWFNALSQPYKNFCEFYPEHVSEPTTPCSNCISGPSTCTCSTSVEACDTSQNLVLDIVRHVDTEVKCQDLCARREDCSWYTWYSGAPLTMTCILLEGCEHRTSCQGCYSGPVTCQNVPTPLPVVLPPQCTEYKELSSYTRNVKTNGNDRLCDNVYCCDLSSSSHSHPDWAGDSWYRFTGDAGTKIQETAPGQHSCGTFISGYMVGGHPTVAEEEVFRTVNFDGSDYQQSIRVINCYQYYVYYLTDCSNYGFDYGYCAE